MAYRKKELMASDTQALIGIIDELQLRLKKKGQELKQVRSKLIQAKGKLARMKLVTEFQRHRILELYEHIHVPSTLSSEVKDTASVL